MNRGDKDGRSPLLVCTGSKGQGALECMQTLIDLGADLDVQDIGGFTALHVAAIGNSSYLKLHNYTFTFHSINASKSVIQTNMGRD